MIYVKTPAELRKWFRGNQAKADELALNIARVRLGKLIDVCAKGKRLR